MALSVDYLYRFALRLIRKNQAGSLTSTEFQDFWNDSQRSYQDDLAGRFQMRSYGKEGANTGLIENETILQKLSPFIESVQLITKPDGSADKPEGFLYRLAMRIDGYDVFKINYNQIYSVTTSVIDPPSQATNTYYVVEYQNFYRFYPTSVLGAEMDCVLSPPNIVWGYTFDADDRQVYNPGTSVQSLWDDNSNMEITKRMLMTIGVSFKDQDFANFGRQVQAAGE